ncbi:MAG: proline--tRNA ligase [Propionibacteriaceae bacterium]|jgi:prolyl-tRNA synthetase|nr:proline--tRNA ligase [Propionibacteriaceae bacterium]
MSQLFVRTLRADPADAELPSHRWLVRAGYIRRVAPGVYSWLPLGLRVLAKVEAIIRQEMDAIGGQEVRFPALLPREPYEASGRWTEYGPNLFRLRDRRGNDYLLGPTHEEMFTLLVKDLYSSHKDLPLSLYQIQTKYRDEARPRAGILRGREFIMKDSYSFDLDDDGLQASYERHRAAYIRIFDRLGFDYVIVQAMSGAMGGSASEEFLALSEFGEDTFVRSPGGYAANVEAVRSPAAAPVDAAAVPAPEIIDTPGAGTIDTLVEAVNAVRPRLGRPWTAADTLKNIVVVLTHPDGRREPLVIGLPGDREVDLKRLQAAVAPAEAQPFTEEDFAQWQGLVKGYIGPVRLTAAGPQAVLGERGEAGLRYLTDPRVSPGTSWVSGANAPGQHIVNLTAGRDFQSDGSLDVAEVKDGDPAPDGSGPLELARGVEMGHIFQLGRKYAEALGLKVLDQDGKLRTVTMGSYGIGVSRAVAMVAEATCDARGLAWPRAVAPFDVVIVVAGKAPEQMAAAEQIAADLADQGVDVVLDDRAVSPGVKFKDAEVIGFPTAVIVGRSLADGVVEIRDRTTGDKQMAPLAEAAARVAAVVRVG